MLHVLLTILKIIGIILLVILGIILFLILLVLFVPVRYRVHVRKDQEVFEVKGLVTWLLHLVRVDLIYAKKSGQAVIRLLGRKIKTIQFLGEPEREDGPEPVSSETDQDRSEGGSAEGRDTAGKPGDTRAEEEKAGQSGEQSSEVSAGIEAEQSRELSGQSSGENTDLELNKDRGQGTDSGQKKELGQSTDSGQKKDRALDTDPGQMKDDPDSDEAKAKEVSRLSKLLEKLPKLVSKLLALVEKLLDLVMRLLYLPYDIYDKYDDVTYRVGAKFDAIRKKVAPFLTMEGEHMIVKVVRYLKKLIRCYGPRKISGYLRFGTSHPDITGTLTGLVYVLLPRAGSEYSVEPDFYDSKFETDTEASGHIRLNHVAWIAIKLLLDKEFWTLLRKIRGKEKNSGHRGRKSQNASQARTEERRNGSGEDFNESESIGEDSSSAGNTLSGSENGKNRSRSGNGHKGNKNHKKAGKKLKRKKTGNRKISKKR